MPFPTRIVDWGEWCLTFWEYRQELNHKKFKYAKVGAIYFGKKFGGEPGEYSHDQYRIMSVDWINKGKLPSNVFKESA